MSLFFLRSVHLMMLIGRLAIAQLCKHHSAYNLHEEDLGGDGSGGGESDEIEGIILSQDKHLSCKGQLIRGVL